MISWTSEIKGLDTPLAKGETNDCVVRALAAMTGCDYEKAHAYAQSALGRRNRVGVSYGALKDRLDKGGLMGKTLVEVDVKTRYKNQGRVVEREMTTQTFFRRIPNDKTFLVIVKGHMFCVKDGVVVGGNVEDAVPSRKRVKKCWVVVDEELKNKVA